MCLSVSYHFGFTPLQTYKVLKLNQLIKEPVEVLHHYKLTRFSNPIPLLKPILEFYTITNLQGSQTSNEIITEPNISVNMRKPPSNV